MHAKKNAELDEDELEQQKIKAQLLHKQQDNDLKLIKDILLTYVAIREKYDTYLFKHQYKDYEENRQFLLKQKNDSSSRRNIVEMQPT